MSKAAPKSRSMRRVGSQDGLRAWARRHAYGFFSSIGEIARRPVASLMTMVVLALALMLPLMLYSSLEHIQQLTANIDRDKSLTVFLMPEANQDDALQLSSQLSSWNDIVAADPIAPDDGLNEVFGYLGFSAASESMQAIYQDNPLPWALELMAEPEADMELLIGKLSNIQGIDQVVADLAWLERLDLILSFGARVVWLLSALLLLAVVFVIANTVRMEVHHRRHQIEVMALVGATAGFIRGPFLYSGFWFGFLSALLAVVFLKVSVWSLEAPLASLAASYGEMIALSPLGLSGSVALMVGMGLAGVLGSFIAVNQYLAKTWL